MITARSAAALLLLAGTVWAVGFGISPKLVHGLIEWSEFGMGIAGDGQVRGGRWLYEGRAQWWVGGNDNDLSTRQSLLFALASGKSSAVAAGGGLWFSANSRDVISVPEAPPDPNASLDRFIEVRPFIEARAEFITGKVSLAPLLRYQVSAYRNFEPKEERYHYLEPAVIFEYRFTDRWAFEARARYWRGVGNDWADVAFLELGPLITW
ncbi:MAG: hypothetical protein JSU81_07530 [Candidatus Coatesbacteria bacterium]|nr:MAG: hypothetical protein JSU81_07530 [Candidatus Coatesbacteria bacterium]